MRNLPKKATSSAKPSCPQTPSVRVRGRRWGSGTESVTTAELKGPSPLHPSRFYLFTVVLALHTGSGNRNKKVLSVSQTHPPNRVRGCSAHPCQKAMGKYRIQDLPSATSVYKKNGSSLTDRHLAGQQAEGYYAAFSLLPIALEESLGLKANIITTSLCFKEGSELSRFVPDEVAKLLMQAQWNLAPIRCYSLAQLFVPAEEAINWWWIGARAREAMIYQHLQCQRSSTSWNSTAKKNWPVLGFRVIFKNWRNRRPPRHLKKNTNHMKNLSIFPLKEI